jgi:hypothetical protein
VRLLGLVVCASVACGRFGFDPSGTSQGDGGAGGDGAMHDGPLGDAGPMIDVAFVTKEVYTGAFGGVAGANAKCRNAAMAAGRSGTFVAFVSSTAQNAVDQLSGSRGWMRTDGVTVIDTAASVFASSTMFSEIDRDQNGTRITFTEDTGVWTGSMPNGMRDTGGNSCTSWTATTGFAWIGDLMATGTRIAEAGSTGSCAGMHHLLCFETGKSVTISPPSRLVTGRYAFVSSARTGIGIGKLDTQCNADATTAGLPGSYLAAVATSTATIRSRFTLDARIVQRRDGTQIAESADKLLGTTDLDSVVNQLASGTYIETQIWTGAADPNTLGTVATTCNDWNDVSSVGTGTFGIANSAASATFWGNEFNGFSSVVSCNLALPVLCLQE